MPLVQWKNQEDFQRFVNDKASGFIFKHSTQCPISSEAQKELQKFLGDRPDVSAYQILVIENRPTSNDVAEAFGIPHSSPQIILVKDGVPVWNDSHWNITCERLEEVYQQA